jgi:hypothetical protein
VPWTTGDAAEPAELLQFLTDWVGSDPGCHRQPRPTSSVAPRGPEIPSRRVGGVARNLLPYLIGLYKFLAMSEVAAATGTTRAGSWR